MQAITVSDREAGVAGMSLTDLPTPSRPTTRSSCGYTPRVSHPGSLTGRTPLSTARAVTAHRACPATICPGSIDRRGVASGT
jgi:hypothetical protein